jgi:hypothetical protein
MVRHPCATTRAVAATAQPRVSLAITARSVTRLTTTTAIPSKSPVSVSTEYFVQITQWINSKNNSFQDDLAIDYQFTFNLSKSDDKHFTAINFKNEPTKIDVDVDFSISCSVAARVRRMFN